MISGKGKLEDYLTSSSKIFIHTAASSPQFLIDQMCHLACEKDLNDLKLYQLHTDCKATYLEPNCIKHFEINNLFIGANVRKAVWEGKANFIPSFLSEVPDLFRNGIIPLDLALISVSPPDKHGYCSLGLSVDASRAAMESAKYVVAQINPSLPRVHGDGFIHISKIDAFVEHDQPIHETILPEPNEVERKIGEYIASLIEDGSTLQMGIGTIPNAVLNQLGNHKNLGIHTEMFSDGVLPLIESGVINNSQKVLNPGLTISGFIIGSRKLYDFVDDNPSIHLLDIAYVNNVSNIKQNPKQVSINSAIEVDITGQVCADSIGTKFYSGVGGQMDFIRGASLSKGGKPIIALPSTTSRGESKIVSMLKRGAGVVTTRAHVRFIVTEYGIADLYGKTIKERIIAMINIAHPDHREQIQKEAYTYYHL